MPTPYEAKRLSGTDLGKTITGTHTTGKPFTGTLRNIEHRPTGFGTRVLTDLTIITDKQLRYVADLDGNSTVELTGKPS